MEITKCFNLNITTGSSTLQTSAQLTQWGPRRHHSLELCLNHRRCGLQLGGGVVDEELHGDIVQPREELLILCGVLAVF